MRRSAVICVLALVATLVAAAWGGPREAAEVLRRLPGEPDLLINLDPSDLPSTSDMIRLGKEATPAIANGLVNSMSGEVRRACAAVLTATRDPRALQALSDALDDPDEEVRTLAARALGAVESTEATGQLLALIDKPRVPADLKEEAVRALGRLGDPRAIPRLSTYFAATWDPAAQEALWSLRRHLTRPQVSALVVGPLRATGDRAPPRRVLSFAVETAGQLAIGDAARPLMARFEQSPALHNAIVHGLGLIGDRSAVPFLRALLDRSAEARLLNNVVFALQRLGEDPVPFLREALRDRRAYIRFNAAFVAGDLKLAALVPALLEALGDLNDYVRGEAAVALGRVGSAEAVAGLEAASREKNPIVRRDALLALAALDYPKYRDRVLAELVRSELDSVRSKAVRFLAGRGDPEVVSPVLAALDPSYYRDREVAIALLDRFWTLDNPDATGFLLRLAATDDGHRHDALRLLARLADERARFVLRQWLHAPAGEQDQLLRAMGRYRDEASLPLAERWLAGSDAAGQLAAAFMLASLGRPAGAERLLEALDKAPVYLKRRAAQLLTELDLERVPDLVPRLEAMLDHPDVYARVYAARPLIQRGHAGAFARLWQELGKRIPFIDDEVLDVVERAPKKAREQVMETWIAQADPHLKRSLERIRARN